MNAQDRTLGMDRSITRRDFLNGVTLSVVGSMLAPELLRAAQQEFAPERAADYYPPTRVGMRGSHPGSFEVAHQLRDRRQVDLTGAINSDETYDLVVVGGGLSGLSAAYYFSGRSDGTPESSFSTTTTTSAAMRSATSFTTTAGCSR